MPARRGRILGRNAAFVLTWHGLLGRGGGEVGKDREEEEDGKKRRMKREARKKRMGEERRTEKGDGKEGDEDG